MWAAQHCSILFCTILQQVDDFLPCRLHYFFSGCSANYTRKNYELLKTELNNVVLPKLLIVVNNIEQVVEPESSPHQM